MGQRNDCKLNALQTQLAKTGQLNDLFLEWLQANGATSDDLNDAQKEFLQGQGVTGESINDLWSTFLKSKMFHGARADMMQQFWCGESGDGSDGGLLKATQIIWPLTTNRYYSTPPGAPNSSFYVALDRNSAATVVDHEGIVRTVLPNELRFQGARRVENELAAPDDFTSGSWSVSGVTKEGVVDGAMEISFGASANDYIRQNKVVSDVSVFSIWVKPVSGSATSCRLLQNNGSSSDIPLDGTWQRISYSRGAAGSLHGIYNNNAGTTANLYIKQSQCEDITDQAVTAPSEYVEDNDSACSVSDIPVRYFDTTNENSVDGNGVVTEAAGSAITPDGMLIEEESSNFCQNGDDVLSWVASSDVTLDDLNTLTFGASATARASVNAAG